MNTQFFKSFLCETNLKTKPESLINTIRNTPRPALAIALVAGLVFSVIACHKHFTFQTNAWDLGIFTHVLWNTINGDFFYQALEEVNHFSVHVQPVLLFFIPLFWIIESPVWLLLSQTVAVSIAIIAVYHLAIHCTKDKKCALVSVLLLCFYHPLHYALFFDFHPVFLSIPMVLFAMLAIEKQNNRATLLFLTGAMLCKENLPLITFFAGLYVAVFQRRFKFGATLACYGLAWLFVTNQIIMPYFGNFGIFTKRYGHLGESPPQVILNFFIHPSKVIETLWTAKKRFYLFKVMVPLAFIPLMGGRALLFIIPGLAQNLLTNYKNQFSGSYQYEAIIIPGMFFSFILGWNYLKRLEIQIPAATKKLQPFLWILPLIVSLFFFFKYSPIRPNSYRYRPRFSAQIRSQLFQQLAAIEKGAKVLADSPFVSHLIQRKDIHMVGFDRGTLPDIIVVDNRRSHPFRSVKKKKKYLKKFKNYSTLAKIGSVTFLKRTSSSQMVSPKKRRKRPK